IVNLDYLLKNISTQKSIKKNFINTNEKYPINTDTDLVIFIAESTSSMMFEKNIQKITNYINDKNLGKIISLQNVYSTHTHSTPSLLRTLSIPGNLSEKKPIKPYLKKTKYFNF
ncbi:hypothetical protein OA849_00185, partial [Candidatus Pelagibacter sp.]|nr:hypothetical protein [Candidatus Pelagibacter sp.]